MRKPTTVPAVLSVAAVLLLSACGGGDDDGSAPATSSSAGAASTSAAPESSADGDTEAFCADAQDALTSIQSAFGAAATDPTQASAAFARSAQELGAVDPPAEIESDWQTLVDGFQQVADETAGLDISTPEGQTQFESVIDGLSAAADPASTSVEDHLSDDCGITGLSPTS